MIWLVRARERYICGGGGWGEEEKEKKRMWRREGRKDVGGWGGTGYIYLSW